MTFAKQPLRQRVIALVAAYAIAFAGVMASFVAAQAAAEAAAQPDNVICHSVIADQPSPAPNGTSNAICADCCCIGCLTMTAAVLPPVAATAVPRALGRLVAPLIRFGAVNGAKFNAHRPRGPPPVL